MAPMMVKSIRRKTKTSKIGIEVLSIPGKSVYSSSLGTEFSSSFDRSEFSTFRISLSCQISFCSGIPDCSGSGASSVSDKSGSENLTRSGLSSGFLKTDGFGSGNLGSEYSEEFDIESVSSGLLAPRIRSGEDLTSGILSASSVVKSGPSSSGSKSVSGDPFWNQHCKTFLLHLTDSIVKYCKIIGTKMTLLKACLDFAYLLCKRNLLLLCELPIIKDYRLLFVMYDHPNNNIDQHAFKFSLEENNIDCF